MSLIGRGRGWGGRLFEAGRLLTFSAFRMGAYSRWALIRGWALIRINTVSQTALGYLVMPTQSNCIYVYVVVNFLSQVIFVFLLFLRMVIYANEVETKEQ